MNVVIVDDQQINVTLMQALIGKVGGCTPIPFTDSRRGLTWCLENEPDLVIVDYMMPDLNGIDFILAFRQAQGKIEVPVLMVTADHEREVRYRALESGATDFLTKPVDRMEFLSRVKNMLALRRSHLALSSRAATLAEEVKKATAEIQAREKETVMRLAKAAEYRDPETGAHILRMANYSHLIARNLGLPEDLQEMILQAAPMHDLGKLGTPDHILLKPGRLTPDEMDIMKRHASDGHEILKGSTSPMLQMAARIALAHHEKYDGSGYPNGIKGEDTPLEARIVAVADVFDALTSERPYKKAWEIERAVDLLKEGSGTHFDPVCLEGFFRDWDAVLAIKERYQDVD
jgi:putative two-component system response regulator